MTEKTYYIVNSKRLAIAISFVSGLKYHLKYHNLDPNKTVYSFENTEELQSVLKDLMELRSKYGE